MEQNDSYDTPWLKSVFFQLVNVPVILSRGESKFRHVVSAIIEGSISAVFLVTISHYDKYSISQLKYFLERYVIFVLDDHLCYGLCD